jgi:large subunit ribosomal protein L29
MKMIEMRLLSTEELKNKVGDARQELMNLHFQMMTGQLTDTSRISAARKTVARFETVLRERELDAKEEGAK